MNINKKRPKNWKIFLGRERIFPPFRKKALKNHPRLYMYDQISMSVPNIFNVSQKNDFKKQIRTLLKSNLKDIILEGGWIMKQTIPMMQN